ncbi:enoyl-CoA hydratase/isomerase family protein [Actinomycetota bacterium]
MTGPVVLERHGAVGIVVIDRPEVLNALNAETVAGIRDAVRRATADETLGALVFTGAGEKAFIAGADIGEVRDYDLATGLDGEMQAMCDEIEACPKPTIAAVGGFALGGGCELALACDIRVASTRARFGLPETALGVLPGAGGTQRISRIIGLGRAVEMVLTGRQLSAEQALAQGLVTDVVEPADLLDHALAVAGSILARGPVATRLAKLVLRAGLDADQRTGLAIERLAQTVLYLTEDKREGTEAFLAKRQPDFPGR